MRQCHGWPRFCVLALAAAAIAIMHRSASAATPGVPIDVFEVAVGSADLDRILASGFDVAVGGRASDGNHEVELALSPADRRRLAELLPDLAIAPWRDASGRTFAEVARSEAAQGYRVWRSWEEPGGIRDQIDRVATDHPAIAQKVLLGATVEGREIVALRLTGRAAEVPEGERPAVLFASAQHAREWLTVEVNRRLLMHLADAYGTDPAITNLLDTTEIWFVLVANPDGYEFSFGPERRLWRKNMRDNDGDGQIGEIDGVDLNRNFDEHWSYDNDGSGASPYEESYRGPSAASEPETQALQSLLARVDFTFMVNYHSAAGLLLYPIGWQSQTRAIDHPVLSALAGTPASPAIEGFVPSLSAGLYITNGETCDYALAVGTLCFTPELTPAPSGSVFVYPDDEVLVEEEFQRNLPFALDVARSAVDPARPVSHLGNTTEPFYVDDFPVSYGDPQVVQVDVARYVGEVVLRYRINDGPVHDAPTSEWHGGRRYGDNGDVAFRRVRGVVAGTVPGDRVAVWFEAGGLASRSFTYGVRSDTGSTALIVAAEDYTGTSPEYARKDGPSYLGAYIDALAANGIAADVYDVDAEGRRAPSLLGVLSHYRAVVWYSGDDIVTRAPGMAKGTASRLANELMVAMRDFVNEGGRLVVAGRYASFQYTTGYEFDPESDAPCDPNSDRDGCEELSAGFTRFYLGADTILDDAGTGASGALHPVVGQSPPFEGLTLGFRRPQGAADHSEAFLATSARLPVDAFPQFESAGAANWDRPGDRPRTGDSAVWSGRAYDSYERLTREIDLSAATDGELRLWLSYETRAPWDAVFVEARRPGTDDWTTLPDLNGHTAPESALNCANENWFARYPQLGHYMRASGPVENRTCMPAGTTGAWHAATGDSAGDWQEWAVDLSAYAGGRVEVSVAYLTYGLPYRGVAVDDVALPDGAATSFEDGLDGWSPSGPPPGHEPNTAVFSRVSASDLPRSEGSAIVVTPDTVLLGFDLSSLATDAERAEVLRRAFDHLMPTHSLHLPSVLRQ